jgi:hypothetical protein
MRKTLFLFLLLLLLWAAPAHAQGGGQSSALPLNGQGAPGGGCGSSQLYIDTVAGNLYDCKAGSWNLVTGGGGGTGFNGQLGSSFQDAAEIAAPSNPSAGNDRLYLSSSDHTLHCLTSAGGSCLPAGSGSVTSFSSGNLPPLFTTSVLNPTTTPALSFSLSNAGGNTIFGNCTGSSGAPSYCAITSAMLPTLSLTANGQTCTIGSSCNVNAGAGAHTVALNEGNGSAMTGVGSGNAGQVLISNGAGADPTFQDPIVSYAYVNLFNAVAATGTQTSAAVRNPMFGQYGTLLVTWASITGSPSGCTLQMQAVDSLGNAVNNASAVSVSPANGTSGIAFTPAATLQQSAQVKVVFACSVYPSTGALTLDFSPSIGTALLNQPTFNQGTQGAQASPWWVRPTDGTNNMPMGDAAARGIHVVPGDGTSDMGTMSNYGTGPGAVKALPVNAAITQSVLPTGAATAANQCGTSSPCEISATGSANGATNPVFEQPTDGTNALGPMTNFGTAPANTTKSIPTNASIYLGAAAPDTNTGNASGQTQRVVLASNQPTVPVSGDTNGCDGSTGSAAPSKACFEGGTDGANLVGLYLDPCKRGAKTRFTINLTASGQIITGTSSKKTYICDFDLVTATAQNIALVEGTGTTCATGTAGMAGGTTAGTGWNFAANGGLTKGNGDAAVFSADSANADNVCLLLSGTGQTSGSGHYVQF